MLKNTSVIDNIDISIPITHINSNKKITRKELLERIEIRRAKLAQVSLELKSHFVGLDHIIDRIISNVEVWYVIPEIITRPVIINLWGMTGVGKTDLVRRFVRALDLSNNFVEIQLTNKGSSSNIYSTSIQSVLSGSNLETGEPGILLLDEMQRFRSIDEDGSEIHDYRFQDVWMLLSDGRFSGATDGKERLFEMLFDYKYWVDYEANKEDNSNDDFFDDDCPTNSPAPIPVDPSYIPGQPLTKASKQTKRRYHQPYYSARRIKKLLRLSESIEEIMTWDEIKKNSVLVKRINDSSLYEGDDYSKLLIFISGNLDEAYSMSDRCEDVDADADVFHEFSLNINLLSIKRALKFRFKPEQIARLGNVHVIYPSLSRISYEIIIDKKVCEIVSNIQKRSGIQIIVDKTIKDFIYRNGVFPTQGVRPLFSTISSFLENSLPSLILTAIEQGVKKLTLSYKNSYIYAHIQGKIYQVKFEEGEIDRIRSQHDPDKHAMVSVHEAGHALMYAKLTGLVPTQIVANATSNGYHSGFIGSHEFVESKQSLLNAIAISLGGRLAEEIIFGSALVTNGSYSDISIATKHAVDMVRNLGMYSFRSKRVNAAVNSPDVFTSNHDTEETDAVVEQIILEQEEKTKIIINDNMLFLKTISDRLITQGYIEQEDFKNICDSFNVKTRIVETNHTVSASYQQHYNDFFNSIAK